MYEWQWKPRHTRVAVGKMHIQNFTGLGTKAVWKHVELPRAWLVVYTRFAVPWTWLSSSSSIWMRS